jgi:hypothetical protein
VSVSTPKRGTRLLTPRRAITLLAVVVLAALAGGIVIGLAPGHGLAGHQATASTMAAAGCGTRPDGVALTSATLLTPPGQAPGAEPSPNEMVSPSPSPSTTPTPSPTPPLKTVGPTPTQSPTPPLKTVGPTPSPSPSKTATPSPSPSKTATPPPTPQLCVGLQAFSGSGDIQPGQTASYAIWVWAVGAPAVGADVRVQTSEATDVTAPSFTVCPRASGSTCSVGNLSTSRSEEVDAHVGVGSQAPGGDHVVLTATATARGARSGSASAAFDVFAPTASDPNGLLSDTALELGTMGGDYPPLVNEPGVTPVNPTTLFPTVSPGSGGSGRLAAGRAAKHLSAVTTAATTPLGTLISGQVLGLAVLAGAVALAFIRFSLRAPQPGGPRKPE